MKYYSGRGDGGETDTANSRVKKDSDTIELVGNLDELNAFLGYAINKTKYDDIKEALEKAEKKIYVISAIVTGYSELVKRENLEITDKDTKELEEYIDKFSEKTDNIIKFVYPNGSESACIINICRVSARKAERQAVKSKIKDKEILSYLNRLSSLLFVLFRLVNRRDSFKEKFF